MPIRKRQFAKVTNYRSLLQFDNLIMCDLGECLHLILIVIAIIPIAVNLTPETQCRKVFKRRSSKSSLGHNSSLLIFT